MSQPNEYNGALIIDKPEGLTSHDVVARLRRILKTKKIGHTGTLDPFATGVLVMLVGKATRLARFLDKDAKSYEANLRFGFETETGDREGTRKGQGASEEGQEARDEGQGEGIGIQDSAVRTARGSEWQSEPPAIAGGLPSQTELQKRVEAVLPEFKGSTKQIPPMYSAKKLKGKKLYELARQGIEVERKPVDINIYEISVVNENAGEEDTVAIRVTCSAGTYIRTLAEDIGKRIGIGCHLAALRRTKAGRFDLEKALTLRELEATANEDRVNDHLISTNTTVAHLPVQMLDDSDLDLISHGMKIDATTEYGSVQNIRLANTADELVAIGEIGPSGKIQPKVVLITQ